MKLLNLNRVTKFVSTHIGDFHESKVNCLAHLNLNTVLKRKNPYLFRAKNIMVASDFVRDVMDAYLSSSEEKLFGDFLESLALFVSKETCEGKKSAATGLDLEFTNKDVHYVVSIKSGPNWGNAGQHRRLKTDLENAVKVLKQSNREVNVQPVLGICYGRSKTSYSKGYMKVTGQNFWYLISGDTELYTKIIEPLGYNAKQHNERFLSMKATQVNLFTEQFMNTFCTRGVIDWGKVVQFNSGNLDLDL